MRMMGTRTKVQRRHVVIRIPTTVDYQYDDIADDEFPHVVMWRGVAASGRSEKDAVTRLGEKLNLEFGVFNRYQ